MNDNLRKPIDILSKLSKLVYVECAPCYARDNDRNECDEQVADHIDKPVEMHRRAETDEEPAEGVDERMIPQAYRKRILHHTIHARDQERDGESERAEDPRCCELTVLTTRAQDRWECVEARFPGGLSVAAEGDEGGDSERHVKHEHQEASTVHRPHQVKPDDAPSV